MLPLLRAPNHQNHSNGESAALVLTSLRSIPLLLARDAGPSVFRLRWGLIPYWREDPKGEKPINASHATHWLASYSWGVAVRHPAGRAPGAAVRSKSPPIGAGIVPSYSSRIRYDPSLGRTNPSRYCG